jgi:hypothetical protein
VQAGGRDVEGSLRLLPEGAPLPDDDTDGFITDMADFSMKIFIRQTDFILFFIGYFSYPDKNNGITIRYVPHGIGKFLSLFLPRV